MYRELKNKDKFKKPKYIYFGEKNEYLFVYETQRGQPLIKSEAIRAAQKLLQLPLSRIDYERTDSVTPTVTVYQIRKKE